MSKKLYKLDETKAGLRILYLLLGNMKFTQSELQNHLKEQGVGATALGSSLEVLHKLGLVVTKPEIRNGNQVKLTYLTEDGTSVAEKVRTINNQLNKIGEHVAIITLKE
jgi:DNA-binding PadR family transcriptional regulator